MDNLPRHDNGALDARYSVTREYTGAPWPQYVVRFCDEWIGSAPTAEGASALTNEHARRRQAGAPAPTKTVAVTPDNVHRMARVLSDRTADACGVNRDDHWNLYGDEFNDDVRAMLEAAQ